jgi:hypothetical protein
VAIFEGEFGNAGFAEFGLPPPIGCFLGETVPKSRSLLSADDFLLVLSFVRCLTLSSWPDARKFP